MCAVALMFPLPLAGHHEPRECAQVQLTPVTDAGKVSTTVAKFAVSGPALATVRV
jgi:hypothetical protein